MTFPVSEKFSPVISVTKILTDGKDIYFPINIKKKIEMINPFQVISICKLICLHKNIHTVTPNVPLYSAKINKKKKKKRNLQ